MIKVSLVMTAYNSAVTIKKSLESVAKQTRGVQEIVVVDDCSTDDTVAVIHSFVEESPDTKVELVRLPYNLGPGIAKRVGIGKCTGDFVYFLDLDDFLPKRAIERLLELQKEHGADLVCGGVAKAINGELVFKDPKKFEVYDNGRAAFEAFAGWKLCNLFANGKLVSKALLDRCPPYSELRLEEDTASVFHWFWNANKVVVDTRVPLYLYNIRDGSVSHVPETAGRIASSIEAWSQVVMFAKFQGVKLDNTAMYVMLSRIKSRMELGKIEDEFLKKKLELVKNVAGL